MRKVSLSIMVPAYNEEHNLTNTINEIKKGLKGQISNYEIIIFNDNSIDKTAQVANRLAKINRKIRVVHNKTNKGMGYGYKKGLQMSKFEHYMYIPGDNQFPAYALAKMVKKLGSKDILIPYVTNMNIRPIGRQFVSYLFTFLVNLAFGLKVKYYNGTVIHTTSLLKSVNFDTDSGHAYQAAILVKLLKAGATYSEIGYDMYERSSGKTSAFKVKNIKRVLNTMANLFLDVQIRKRMPVLVIRKNRW